MGIDRRFFILVLIIVLVFLWYSTIVKMEGFKRQQNSLEFQEGADSHQLPFDKDFNVLNQLQNQHNDAHNQQNSAHNQQNGVHNQHKDEDQDEDEEEHHHDHNHDHNHQDDDDDDDDKEDKKDKEEDYEEEEKNEIEDSMRERLEVLRLRIKEKDHIKFLVIGDWGTASGGQIPVAERMGEVAQRESVDFVISVGDNFYVSGIKNTSDPLLTRAFESVYSHPSLQVPWFISVGNHDSRGSVEALIDYTKTSSRWSMPSRYYDFSWELGNHQEVRFIVLDTSLMLCNSPNPSEALDVKSGDCRDGGTPAEQQEQLKWLKEVLGKSADFTVVVGHVPIFSSGHHLDTKYLVDELLPLFRKHRVDLYLSGHDHMLQHLRESDDPKSTDFVISGGGGYVADAEINANKHLVKAYLVNGFLLGGISVAGKGKPALTMDFIDVDKTAPIYSFQRTRG